MNVLVFDTAAPVIGVGLLCGTQTTSRTERVIRGSERRLLPLAAELLAEAGLTPSQLDGVAAVAGPGAFTGLRVGLATAAGLAQSLVCPLWTTSSLGPRAAAAGMAGSLLVLLDARKSRVYAARWVDGIVTHPAADVAPEVALGWGRGPFRTTGEGALVYGALVEAAGGTVVDGADLPGVEDLARMSGGAFQAGLGIEAKDVSPEYLRAPDAVPRKR